MKEILKKIRALLNNETLKLVRTTQDERILIAGEQYCPLHEGHAFLRRLFYKEHGIFVETKKIQSVIDYLDMQPLTIEEPSVNSITLPDSISTAITFAFVTT